MSTDNPTPAPADTRDRDEVVKDFVLVLAATCDGLDIGILLEAVSRFLALVVARHTRTRAGLDAFSELFGETLQDEWQYAQQQKKADAGGPTLVN
jgi:hypothetical protein